MSKKKKKDDSNEHKPNWKEYVISLIKYSKKDHPDQSEWSFNHKKVLRIYVQRGENAGASGFTVRSPSL